MIAGLIVAAVGDQLVIARPGGDTDAVTSVVLYAGPAMFLLAQSWFILKAFGRVPPSRPVALIAFAALAFATPPATHRCRCGSRGSPGRRGDR